MNEQDFLENHLIILTKQTLDAFLNHDNPADLIALYVFYYYTAKWQKTNQPKSTTRYTATGLGWAEAKVRRVKKQLIDLGLISDVKAQDASGRINGHYIRINYILKEKTVQDVAGLELHHPNENPQYGEIHSMAEPHYGKTHSMENDGTNALSANNLNALSPNNTNALSADSEGTKRKRFIPPTVDEVRAYCMERNNRVDPQRFIDHYTSNGWLVGRNKMKDWKAAVRTWERNSYPNSNAPQRKAGYSGMTIDDMGYNDPRNADLSL